MRIGEYRIVIQEAGREVLIERTAATGHPLVGEEMELNGDVFVVERVVHREEATVSTRRQYTWPHLFTRRRDAPEGDGPPESRSPSARVLPFRLSRRPGARSLSSLILPAELVAVLVACGYDAQAQHYRLRSRGAAQLRRAGQRWLTGMGESPCEAQELAREARRGLVAARGVVRALSPSAPTAEAARGPPATAGERAGRTRVEGYVSDGEADGRPRDRPRP